MVAVSLMTYVPTSPRVDDEVRRRVDGEEQVRERDHPVYEGRRLALRVALLGPLPLAVDHLVDVGHDLGRLAEDKQHGNADQDPREVVLPTLPARRAVVATGASVMSEGAAESTAPVAPGPLPGGRLRLRSRLRARPRSRRAGGGQGVGRGAVTKDLSLDVLMRRGLRIVSEEESQCGCLIIISLLAT